MAGTSRSDDRPGGLFGPVPDGEVLLPRVRMNLRDALETIAAGDEDHPVFGSELDEIPDFADDHVHVFIRDHEEAAAVQAVADVLTKIQDERGGRWDTSVHWPHLLERARHAADVMNANSQMPPPPAAATVVEAIDLVLAGSDLGSQWASQWLVHDAGILDHDIRGALEALDATFRGVDEEIRAQLMEARARLLGT